MAGKAEEPLGDERGVTYTRSELAGLRADMDAGREPGCPRCGAGFDERAIPPSREVPYVRRRAWLLCRGCGRSAVLDVPRAR